MDFNKIVSNIENDAGVSIANKQIVKNRIAMYGVAACLLIATLCSTKIIVAHDARLMSYYTDSKTNRIMQHQELKKILHYISDSVNQKIPACK